MNLLEHHLEVERRFWRAHRFFTQTETSVKWYNSRALLRGVRNRVFADGQAAKAFRAMALVVAALFLCPLIKAQTPTPTPPASLLTHLSISGTATGVMGVGNQGATILAADFQITKTVGVEYQQIMVPSSSNSFDIGAITYTRPLAQVLGKNITSKLLFDVTGWNVTAFAGAGRIVSNGKHAAETAGLRLSCPLNTNVTFQMLSVQWLHGPQTNGLITSPSTAAISSGLKISF